MKIVFISDTHDLKPSQPIPDGDVLVHCGDIFGPNTPEVLIRFNEWMGNLQHAHKVVIAGNHDWLFQTHNEQARALLTNVIYLQDESTEINGLKFYGSPWQP